MKKILFLVFITILISCKEDEKNIMYGFLQEQFYDSSNILRDQISETVVNKNFTDKIHVKEYDSLTKQYLLYLEGTYSDLTNQLKLKNSNILSNELSKIEYGNDFFFDGEYYSKKGTEYITQMEKYRTEILNLVEDKNLRKRINLILKTSDYINRKGENIKYLDWFYKDMPIIAILTHIRNQERTILEIENDFLKNKLMCK